MTHPLETPFPPVVPLQTCDNAESVSVGDMVKDEEVDQVKEQGVQVGFHSERTGSCSQTDIEGSQIRALQQQHQQLKDLLRQSDDELKQLEVCHGEQTISSFQFQLQEDDEMCKFYLGFAFQKFEFILNFLDIQNTENGGTNKKNRNLLTETHEFIIFLLRIRGGLDPQDISYRFGLPIDLVSQTVDRWIQLVYSQFSSLRNSMFFSHEKIKETLPKRFSKLSNVRVIVDCAELFCERPSNFPTQSDLFSNCDDHITFKVLLGCSPNGVFSFVSELFEGSVSDTEIFQKSGLIDLLESEDIVLADGEFSINGIAVENRFKINVPAYVKGREKLTPQEEIETSKITRIRIFGERDMVQRLAEFRILNGIIPLNVREVLSEIVFICACLLNFNPPFLDE